MSTVRRAHKNDFGERYVIDRELFVGARPRRFWLDPTFWTATTWGHVAGAIALVIILLVAIIATGHHVEPFKP